ncbi:MAG: Zn-dependent protease [Bacteroidetes bacterium]|nr:Zn-dependent protease [Bacteroidota bacterium]
MKKLCLIFTLLLFFISCSDKQEVKVEIPDPALVKEEPLFYAVYNNDVNLQTPKYGQWLYEHKESGQTFEEYLKLKPVRPNDSINTIFIQPFGEFTNEETETINKTAEYVKLFFGLNTQVLPLKADNSVPDSAKREHDGSIQILSPYLLEQTKKAMPPKGIVLMTITKKDLYPKDDWNFVFGQASYVTRTGVSSIHRFKNDLPDSLNSNSFLSRLINVTTHEIGHMFSIRHCTFARCLMNGANNLNETDGSPNRLCSNCLKKLYWNLRFDNIKRMQQLKDFFYENKLWRDHELMNVDLEILKIQNKKNRK